MLNAEVTRRTYFGEKARTYDEGRDAEDKWRREEAAVAQFLAGAAGTVLDIPVGTGRFLALYRRLGLACIGMDVSDEMMSQARAKDAAADLRHGDALAIPMPDQSVDHAVCIRLLTLIETEEAVTVMKEIARVTRDRVIVSLKSEPARRVENRCIVHPHSVVAAAGLKICGEIIARAPSYRVVSLARA